MDAAHTADKPATEQPKVIDRFDGEYNFLSNFSAHSFTDENLVVWPTNEHYFQAMKTTNKVKQLAIAKCGSPSVAKSLGRQVPLRENWESLKCLFMYRGIEMKFFQNPRIADALIRTGDAELIEGNTWGDRFWGVCQGEGKNMLGQLLMMFRLAESKNVCVDYGRRSSRAESVSTVSKT